MKVLIDVSEEIYNKIKEVNKDSSLSNFILVAIENQISLEEKKMKRLVLKKKSRNLPIRLNKNIMNLKNPRNYRKD